MSNALEQASLIMVPSGYEDGTLGSLKPTDGSGDFTFSRGSDISATRVNAAGYIEKGYENLLLQSNTFNTSWTTNQVSITSGQTGYDGSSDAWLLSKSSSHGRVFQSITKSGVQTFSVYAKAATSSWLRIVSFTTSFQAGFFDLSNGIAGSIENAIDTTIEDVGNDWYRCSVQFSGNTTQVRIYPAEANSSIATSGSIYIQDAMLNQGLVAYPYIETTTAPVAGGILEDMPRLDYSNGSCPALLLEPQRTNLIPYSEYYEGSSYVLETNATLDSTLYESPEGVNNAYKLNLPSIISRITHPVQYNGAHTFSVWMKADTSGTISLRCAIGNPAVSEQKNVTTEWQRFDITATDANYWQVIRNSGDTLSSVYIYGHQIEQASYPTSYIPTYGVSQTRLEDFASATNVASLIGQNEGSYFIEFQAKRLDEVYSMFSINDGTNNNRIQLTFTDSGTNPRIGFFYFVNGVNGFQSASIQNLVANQTYKFAVTYTQSSLSAYLDGTQIINETGLSLSGGTFNEIAYGLRASSSSFRFNMPVNQTLVFPTALSDDECIALTTIS